MARFSELPAEEQARLEQAAFWHHQIGQGVDVEDSEQFRRWFSEQQNRQAFLAVKQGQSLLSEMGTSPEILDMRRAALGRARRRGAWRWFPRRTASLVAATIICVVAVAAVLFMQLPATYATGIGERRVVALPDGSRVSLDSNSVVQVRYRDAARMLELKKGRARFAVVHDATRPFTVTAGSETVIAIGTSFDVELLNSKVLVTLIQGHVVVKDSRSDKSGVIRRPLSLAPGDQLVSGDESRPAVLSANLQTAAAWEAGRLVFQDEPLGEAVERINRYTNHPVLVDAAVADIRISGVFNAGDIGSFVNAVTAYFPVQATTTGTSIQLEHRS